MTTNKTPKTNELNDLNEKYLGVWTQAMDEQMGRFESTLAELAQRNDQVLEAANAAIGQWAKLAQETATVSHQMSTEWIKTVRGTALQAGEMMNTVAKR
jgi:hypothetical protein